MRCATVTGDAQLLEMMAAAVAAREAAYAPYSGYKVGAAVLGGSGKAYLGCNVENASFGMTVCAERVAILKAISEGESAIQAVAIVAGEDGIPRPCGACLQVMAEFAQSDEPLKILVASVDGGYEVHALADYLPMPFRLEE